MEWVDKILNVVQELADERKALRNALTDYSAYLTAKLEVLQATLITLRDRDQLDMARDMAREFYKVLEVAVPEEADNG